MVTRRGGTGISLRRCTCYAVARVWQLSKHSIFEYSKGSRVERSFLHLPTFRIVMNKLKSPRSGVDGPYTYTDENGKPHYRVVRTKFKNFYQERSDGNEGWIRGRDGTRDLPYNYPEVLGVWHRGADGESVFI